MANAYVRWLSTQNAAGDRSEKGSAHNSLEHKRAKRSLPPARFQSDAHRGTSRRTGNTPSRLTAGGPHLAEDEPRLPGSMLRTVTSPKAPCGDVVPAAWEWPDDRQFEITP